MQTPRYQRTVEELGRVASMFWPAELSEQAATLSVIPKLLETQDQFLSILTLELSEIDKLFQVAEIAELSANLFLKHLVVLADFGGERLQRVNSEFQALFPEGSLKYIRDGKEFSYSFRSLPIEQRLTNTKLGIDGQGLLQHCAIRVKVGAGS